MPVFRVNKENNYTVVDNHILRDKNASLKAKGLLVWMLSCSEDWNFTLEGMKKCLKEGDDAISSALKELETLGYLVRTKLMPESTTDENGNKVSVRSRIEYVYNIYEQPHEIQDTDFQCVENPRQRNTKEEIPKEEKVNGIPFTPAEPASRSHSKIYASKQADKLKDDLGGLGEKDPEIKKEKPKKKTLYQKCIDAIDDPTYGFTDNVKKALTDYLSFVLQPAEKSVKGINQWTYKLKALVKFSTDPNEQEQIISKSLQLGYYGFFALDYYKQKRGNRPPVDDVIIEHRTQEEKEADLAERKLKFNGY